MMARWPAAMPAESRAIVRFNGPHGTQAEAIVCPMTWPLVAAPEPVRAGGASVFSVAAVLCAAISHGDRTCPPPLGALTQIEQSWSRPPGYSAGDRQARRARQVLLLQWGRRSAAATPEAIHHTPVTARRDQPRSQKVRPACRRIVDTWNACVCWHMSANSRLSDEPIQQTRNADPGACSEEHPPSSACRRRRKPTSNESRIEHCVDFSAEQSTAYARLMPDIVRSLRAEKLNADTLYKSHNHNTAHFSDP